MRSGERVPGARDKRIGVSSTCAALLFCSFAAGVGAAEYKPQIWGYGVKGCRDFETAAADADRGSQEALAEYRRYQDWLTGLVTGLSLATGQDVLKGTGIAKGMESIRKNCRSRPGDDFFNVSMDLVRALSLM